MTISLDRVILWPVECGKVTNLSSIIRSGKKKCDRRVIDGVDRIGSELHELRFFETLFFIYEIRGRPSDGSPFRKSKFPQKLGKNTTVFEGTSSWLWI